MTVQGKKIVITGSSRGIGAAIARQLAASGAHVAVTYAGSESSAKSVIDSLDGDGHLCAHLDVRDSESVTTCFKSILETFGQIDGLVNNAGITKDQLILRMKDEDFDEVIQTNLRGTFLCTKSVLKPMMKARSGSIVNITSVIGQMGNPGQANYAASKAGIEAFSKSVAKELGSRGIRVNCVAPGYIVTEMTEALNEQQKSAILPNIPLNSLGDVNDVAKAVQFLLSEDAKYVTGQTLSVNGGMHM
ncbi:MAG: 3-oxoacyl-[acyl-carrier-protein] reductase [Pseudobdellovibrionaceae bacterium]|nr:3-oxoacyl-[acyl-carrier-protein] reductase [Bdellovibrionales bacterium]USN48190.1 MAG: 3-oxoacyl-[acyl-carrier-protein] reductase [Pseudobdellovibrionaceae bacterium]